MSVKSVAYSIDIQNNASSKINQVSKDFRNLDKSATSSGGALGGLEDRLSKVGVDIGGITSKVTGFTSVLAGPVGLAVGAGAVVAAMGALALSSASTGAHIMDLSDNSGVAAGTLMKFRNVAELGNVDLDTLSGSLFKMSKIMIENGAEWKSLGIKSKDTMGAFIELKEKVAQATDPLEKQDIAMKALGKSAEKLMPLLKMNNEQFREVMGNTTGWTQEQIEAGAALDDQLVMMKQTFRDLKDSIGNALIPVFAKVLDYAKETWFMWKDMLTTNPSTKMQENGLAVKVNTGPRVHTQDLSMSNVNSTDAQAKLKAMTSTELLDLSVWARVEKQNDELANFLVKMSSQRKEEIRKAEEKAFADAQLADKNKKTAEAVESYKQKWEDLAKANSYSVFAENKKIENFTSQKRSENQAKWESENPTLDTINSDWAMKQTLGNVQGYDKGIGGNINPLNYNNPLHSFAKSQKPGTGGYTPEDQLNSDQIAKIAEAIAKERAELVAANAEFARQKEIIGSITGSIESGLVQPFDNFVRHIGSGNKSISGMFKGLFSDIQDSFSNMLAQMLAQLMAKAAIFGILNLLSGGGFGGATSMLQNFKWFASGTNYATGGMAYINEKSRGGAEAVYLPDGAKVKQEPTSSQVNHFSIHLEKGMDENEITYKLEEMLAKRERVYRS